MALECALYVFPGGPNSVTALEPAPLAFDSLGPAPGFFLLGLPRGVRVLRLLSQHVVLRFDTVALIVPFLAAIRRIESYPVFQLLPNDLAGLAADPGVLIGRLKWPVYWRDAVGKVRLEQEKPVLQLSYTSKKTLLDGLGETQRELEGEFLGVWRGRAIGWVDSVPRSKVPLLVELYAGGRLLGRALANQACPEDFPGPVSDRYFDITVPLSLRDGEIHSLMALAVCGPRVQIGETRRWRFQGARARRPANIEYGSLLSILSRAAARLSSEKLRQAFVMAALEVYLRIDAGQPQAARAALDRFQTQHPAARALQDYFEGEWASSEFDPCAATEHFHKVPAAHPLFCWARLGAALALSLRGASKPGLLAINELIQIYPDWSAPQGAKARLLQALFVDCLARARAAGQQELVDTLVLSWLAEHPPTQQCTAATPRQPMTIANDLLLLTRLTDRRFASSTQDEA